jgi:hypothetical protein
MDAIVEKLKMVMGAEEKAAQIIIKYERMAEETISLARDEVEKTKEREIARAREEGAQEMERIIQLAAEEAEGIREEYKLDRTRLLEEVAERRNQAVAFLLEKLEGWEL